MKKVAVIYLLVVLFLGLASTANAGGIEQCGSVDVFGQAFLDSVANGSPDPTLLSPNIDASLAVLYATGRVTDRKGRVDLIASIYRTPEAGLNLTGPSIADPTGTRLPFWKPL